MSNFPNPATAIPIGAPVLEIEGLTKRYLRLTAVDNLTLSVPRGSVYGLLGPNGSGKTTTLAMILGVMEPDGGSFRWFGGQTPADARKHIGALLETPNFYAYLSATENLKIVADIKRAPHSQIDDILRLVNLYDRRNSAFKTYSLGMKQRLAIAAALLGNPDVLVLDEPTNGLDPQGIAEIRSLVQTIAKQGKTILLASHLLDEVEKVCTHVAMIKKGKLLTAGTMEDLLRVEDVVELGAADLNALGRNTQAFPGVIRVRQHNNLVLADVQHQFVVEDLCRHLVDKGTPPNHLVRRRQKLEAQFLEVIAQTEGKK